MVFCNLSFLNSFSFYSKKTIIKFFVNRRTTNFFPFLSNKRGSVSNLLHDPKNRVPFKRRMRFARDTALAMNAMHLSKPAIL